MCFAHKKRRKEKERKQKQNTANYDAGALFTMEIEYVPNLQWVKFSQ